MRALVVGGNGFIGSHLVDALLGANWSVAVLDVAPERFRPPLPGVDYLFGGFDDQELAKESLSGVDVAFLLASTSTPGTSNAEPRKDVAQNLLATLSFLEEAAAARLPRLVYLSSGGAVYGEPRAATMDEDHPTEPESSYGIVKLAAEKYLALFRRLRGLDSVIIRPANPVGPRQSPAGAQGIIPIFLGRMKAGLPIEVWGDGSIVRDYFAVEDLARGIVSAAESQRVGAIFNMGSGIGHSILEIVGMLETVTGLEADVRFREARAIDPPRVVLDCGRAKRELGWSPEISLESSIRATWNFLESGL